MKIAVIAPTYLPARRANTVQVLKMAQALVQLGHTARVAVPGKNREPVDQAQLAHQYGLGIILPVEWLATRPIFRSYDFGLQAVKWAKQWGAEMVYTRHLQTAAVSSQRGMPTILEVHDFPQNTSGQRLLRWFTSGRGARRLVMITRALANDLAERAGITAKAPFGIVLPDGVDLERFESLPLPGEARTSLINRGVPLAEARFTAGYTGHLYPGRGTGLILELADRLPEINFLLAGGEPEAVGALGAEVSLRKLKNVILTGFVANAELPVYQAACDVLLMPYQRRVAASSGGDIARYLSPMKLFEYLACGKPILSSDLPVLREVLDENNAILLPPEDVERWVQALTGLLENPERRVALGEKARQTAQKFRWEERARQMLEGVETA